MQKKTSILVLIMVVLLIISGAGAFFLYTGGASNCIAKVYDHDALLYEIDLNTVGEPYTINIENENGYNLVQVEKGKIGVIEASCPDKICVSTGSITNGRMPIVCLPNHIVIVVEAQEGEYDAQVY